MTTSLREEFEKLPEGKTPDCVEWDAYGQFYKAVYHPDCPPSDFSIQVAALHNTLFRGFCLAWKARALKDVGICEAHVGYNDYYYNVACREIAAAIKESQP